MSALTDLFTAMANKIRSKTGTQTTYTPSEMVSDGIDDVYDAGVASATTPITPSNSSPASMTANTGYKPTANGYAVETVGSATASNINPPAVGVDVPIIMSSATGRQSVRIVDSITEVTPSNSSPVMLSANSIAQIKDAGVAISSYTGITPSNSSPVSLSSGSIYKMSGGGYAISSYSSKTPSDTSPASVSSGAIIKASSAGYLYKTLQTKGVTLLGSVSISDTSAHTVTLSASVKNYRYLLCSHTVYEDGQVATNPSSPSVMAFIDSDNYVSGWTINAGYVTGSSGAMTPRTATLTYVSNTSISVKQTNTGSRTYRFYGVN